MVGIASFRKENRHMIVRKWLENQCNGKYWKDYLKTYGYSEIAIYGAGELGRYLVMELQSSEIRVIVYVDRNANELNEVLHIPVITLDEFISIFGNKVDALIVTATSADREVLREIVCRVPDLPVMSLRDMIFEM